MCSSSPPAPDYGPMSAASDYAADLGYKLGSEQLEEGKRQYEENRKVADPVIKAQLGLMEQARAQGDDYYEYGKSGRPVEAALNAQSMQDTTGAEAAERNLITGGDTDIYNARAGDIEQGVGRAVATSRQGLTAEYNRLMRQGLRYGYSPAAMAARLASSASTAGLGVVSAANAARDQGIARAREQFAQRRNMGIQDTALGWGRKMDVAGLYRNMPGASQGAYGIALGAGNAATANQMQPGQALMAGMAQGAGMQQTGAGQKIQGYGNVLNSQTSAYNTAQSQPSTLGALLGAGVSLATASSGSPFGLMFK